MIGRNVWSAIMVAVTVISTAHAEDLPLWEIAVGGGLLTVPEYRGSDDQRTLPIPFLFPMYRGKHLRIDDAGIRGILLETKKLNFDFSVDANTDVDSGESDARAGMPDLDPTLQIGPLLSIRLMTDLDRQHSLFLNLPVRSVFSVSFDEINHVGYTASPHLTYYKWFDMLGRNWRLGLSGGLEFGSNEFHDYYYRVDPEFATATRPEFNARGGYGGTRFIVTLLSRTRKAWISFFARYDRFDGADFGDSPLVERDDGLTLGFIVSRFILRSKNTVDVDCSKTLC